MNLIRPLTTFSLLALLLPLSMEATYAEESEVTVTLVRLGGKFSPSPLVVPVGQKIRLVVDNQDNDAMEFESASLFWEIVIPPHHKTPIHLTPLTAGNYDYFNDDNHQEKGIITATASAK
ncbi:MAG: cupredoxin domain-containing protein [Ferrovum sp.]|nr:cupredoxin domain-containing protein [Ferrovum sp.]NDU87785.1 cupredoxin domain-containing protein [Ferrovum sp.]